MPSTVALRPATGKRVLMEKIALFLPDLGGGGAERVMLNLAGELSGQFDVDLVLARGGGAFASVVPQGVRVVDLSCRRMLSAIPALVRYLLDTRPSVVLSTRGHANI